LPHLRTSPDALSAAEAQTFEQSEADRFKQDATEAMAAHSADSEFQTSANAVHDNVLGQLNEANRFTGDVNKGTPHSRATSTLTQAHKLGITPEEMFKRYPLKIQAESVAGEHQLDQPMHIPRAEGMSAEHSEIQERFARQVESDPEKAVADYAKLKDTDGGTHSQHRRRARALPRLSQGPHGIRGGARTGFRLGQGDVPPQVGRGAQGGSRTPSCCSPRAARAPARRRACEGSSEIGPRGEPRADRL
jgi:hypothetical protein